MKKTLIASAIAATFAANAFAEEADLAKKIKAMPTVYGSIELVHINEDYDDSTKSNKHEFEDNGSTLGIKHQHAISDGLTAFAKAEFEFGADEDVKDESPFNKLDEAYVGIKGYFGSIQVGSDDTVYEWVDMLDTNEAVGLAGELAKDKEGDNLQYVSPKIAGGLVLGVTAPLDSDSVFGGAIAAKYAMDNVELAIAYALGREDSDELGNPIEAGDAIGLAATFSIDQISLIAQYETLDESSSGAKNGKDTYGLLGLLNAGQNTFALGYQATTYDAASKEDSSDIYLQALHNFSDNMYVYLEYLMQTDVKGTKDSDQDTLALGATYKF